jgi:hypothetical protein
MGRLVTAFAAVVVVVGVVGAVPAEPADAAVPQVFTDVAATDPFATAIAWLAGEGITMGCNPPANSRFCPDDAVTRGEMAAFLVRAFDYTDLGTRDFVDDDDSIFEADIEKLAAAGVTLGCNPPDNDRFCPSRAVTRGEMAAFLVRAFDYTDSGMTDFVDDDGSIFEADIERLAAAGVTVGCNPPDNTMFCPDQVTTREQMAAFLHRAFGQPEPVIIPAAEGRTADHTFVDAYASIPGDVVAAVADLHIYYGHTSHGSQLVTGVNTMPAEWHLTNLVETSPDLGYDVWEPQTDEWLANHPETEVVIWSWCGQQSSNSVENVQEYLADMTALEAKYPDVQFVYMTGHLRGAYSEYLYGDAENEILQRNNQMVRDYAALHGKWLFDFADIESYLDGSEVQCTYHGMPVECTWPNDATGCAHSRMGNCERKGEAWYTLLAKMTGWDG